MPRSSASRSVRLTLRRPAAIRATEPGRVHHRRGAMTNLRTVLLVPFGLAVILTACSGTAPSTPPASSTQPPSASPSGPALPITTPEAAMAAIVAVEPRFAGIGPKNPDLIGQSAWYEAKPASGVGAFVVNIQVGWGDCPSGCIERHDWSYAVTPDGAVTLLSEGGDAVPPEALPTQSGAGGTGISGRAIAGPTCPVEQPGDPACVPRRVAGAIVVVSDASGTEVGTMTTRPDGSFAFDAAGRRVRRPGSAGRRADGDTVTGAGHDPAGIARRRRAHLRHRYSLTLSDGRRETVGRPRPARRDRRRRREHRPCRRPRGRGGRRRGPTGRPAGVPPVPRRRRRLSRVGATDPRRAHRRRSPRSRGDTAPGSSSAAWPRPPAIRPGPTTPAC